MLQTGLQEVSAESTGLAGEGGEEEEDAEGDMCGEDRRKEIL